MPYAVLDESTAAAAFVTTQGAPLNSVGETLASLREELLAQLLNRDDVTPARLDRWINWANRNVSSMLTLKECFGSSLISVVASQPFYLLPIQVAWIKRLSVSDAETYMVDEGRELDMIDEAKYRTLPVEDGEPTQYFRWRRMAVLWPTPETDRSLSLDYKVRFDDLVEETDSPVLPPEFHEAILLSAVHRAYRSLKDAANAQLAYNDFLTCIRPLQNTDAEETTAQNGTFRPARHQRDLYRST